MAENKPKKIEDLEENEYLDNRKIIGGVGDEVEISKRTNIAEAMPTIDTSRKDTKGGDETTYLDKNNYNKEISSENNGIQKSDNNEESKISEEEKDKTQQKMEDIVGKGENVQEPKAKFDATVVDPVGQYTARPVKRKPQRQTKKKHAFSYIPYISHHEDNKEGDEKENEEVKEKVSLLSSILIALHIKKKPEKEKKEAEKDKEENELKKEENQDDNQKESDKKKKKKSKKRKIDKDKSEDENNKETEGLDKKKSKKTLILMIVGVLFLLISIVGWYFAVGNELINNLINKNSPDGNETEEIPPEINKVDPEIPRVNLPDNLENDEFINKLNNPENYRDPYNIKQLLKNTDINSIDKELQELKGN